MNKLQKSLAVLILATGCFASRLMAQGFQLPPRGYVIPAERTQVAPPRYFPPAPQRAMPPPVAPQAVRKVAPRPVKAVEPKKTVKPTVAKTEKKLAPEPVKKSVPKTTKIEPKEPKLAKTETKPTKSAKESKVVTKAVKTRSEGERSISDKSNKLAKTATKSVSPHQENSKPAAKNSVIQTALTNVGEDPRELHPMPSKGEVALPSATAPPEQASVGIEAAEPQPSELSAGFDLVLHNLNLASERGLTLPAPAVAVKSGVAEPEVSPAKPEHEPEPIVMPLEDSPPAAEPVVSDQPLALPPVVKSLPAALEVAQQAASVATQHFTGDSNISKSALDKEATALANAASLEEFQVATAPRARILEQIPLADGISLEASAPRPMPEMPSSPADEAEHVLPPNIKTVAMKRDTSSTDEFLPTTPALPEPEAPAEEEKSPLGPLSIDSDRVETNNVSGDFTFTGNVDMVCEKFRLLADKIQASSGQAGEGMQNVRAEGNIRLTLKNQSGKQIQCVSQKAIFDSKTEQIRLLGWPRIDEGNRSLVANEVTTEFLIDAKTGQFNSSGAAKTVMK